MFRRSLEVQVGLLFVAAIGLAVIFLWFISGSNPFSKTLRFQVDYQFAGGIEKGSPVRVAGVKAGQVEAIEFCPPSSANAVRLTLSISKEGAGHVRKDSKFFINMASAMGDRYVDISPGTATSAPLRPGDVFRGEDPPRIDQFLSQGLSLAGKVTEFIERNEPDLRKVIRVLGQFSSADLQQLVSNLNTISSDVKILTAKTKSAESQHALQLLYDLLLRLEPLDKEAVENFFQKKGVKTKIF